MKPFDISIDHNINLIEYAGNTIDRYELMDSSTPNLTEVCFQFKIPVLKKSSI